MKGLDKKLAEFHDRGRSVGITQNSCPELITRWINNGKVVRQTSQYCVDGTQSNQECHICLAPLDGSAEAFINHANLHPEFERYKCKECPNDEGNSYVDPLPFFEHRQNEHRIPYPGGMDIYYCRATDDCTFKSLIKDIMNRHLESIHPSIQRVPSFKLKFLPCPHCTMKFGTNQRLDRHVESVHSKSLEERKKLNCPKCEQKFVDEMHLRAHFKTKHLNIKEYRCKICDLKFSNTSNLKEHIGIRHLGYANGKEWRKPENKAVRAETTNHEAYEYVQFKWKDKYMKG